MARVGLRDDTVDCEGSKKLGQPVPDSNFESERKSSATAGAAIQAGRVLVPVGAGELARFRSGAGSRTARESRARHSSSVSCILVSMTRG